MIFETFDWATDGNKKAPKIHYLVQAYYNSVGSV